MNDYEPKIIKLQTLCDKVSTITVSETSELEGKTLKNVIISRYKEN